MRSGNTRSQAEFPVWCPPLLVQTTAAMSIGPILTASIRTRPHNAADTANPLTKA